MFAQKDEWRVPAAITDTGCERELNEDRYAVVECASGQAWLVCDGMGGEAGGELAAQLALDSIRRNLERSFERPPEEALLACIDEANRTIVLRRQNPAFSQMGTTIVACMIQGSEIAIAHVGDSRAYHVFPEGFEQLTEDHSYVQELVNRGGISQQEALSHPQAHMLTRCIGSEATVKIDSSKHWVWRDKQAGYQSLVLCSDGLYSLVDGEELASIIRNAPPKEACAEAVQLAKERGGFDNITLAIIPLAGSLQHSAPKNYKPREYVEPEPIVFKGYEEPVSPWWRVIVTTTLISALAALLTTMGVAMYLSA